MCVYVRRSMRRITTHISLTGIYQLTINIAMHLFLSDNWLYHNHCKYTQITLTLFSNADV